MSEEPNPLLVALILSALGVPLLALSLRRAARVLPTPAPSSDRWPPAQAFAVIGAPFVAMLVVGAVLGATGAGGQDGPGLLAIVASQLVLGAGAGLACVLAAGRARGLEGLGVVPRLPSGALSSVLLLYGPLFLTLLGVAALWRPVCTQMGWDTQQEVVRVILDLERGELIAGAIAAVVVAPVVEELLFRGFLQGFFGQYVGPRAGLVIASALFASLHGEAALPVLFALSLVLGWLQMRTRCVWVPCLAHALNNAVMLGLALAVARASE